MSLQTRTRWRAGLVGTVALATGLSLGVLPAAQATPDGHWTTLSKGNIDTVRQPSVHRFGRDLQVNHPPQGQQTALYTRIVAANGKPKTAAIRIIVWDGIIADPVIFGVGSQASSRSRATEQQRHRSLQQRGGVLLHQSDRTDLDLGAGRSQQGTAAYGSYGTAAIDYSARRWSPSPRRLPHASLSITGSLPQSRQRDPMANLEHRQLRLRTGLGEDASNSNVWGGLVLQQSLRTEGVNAQRIYPSEGSLAHAPKSFLARGGAATSTAPDQDLPAVSDRPAPAVACTPPTRLRPIGRSPSGGSGPGTRHSP